LFKRFKKIVTPNSRQSLIAAYFKDKKIKSGMQKDVVLVQCVEDEYYFGLFGLIVSSLCESYPVRVEQYIVRCLNVGESYSFLTFIKNRLIINPLLKYKWKRLFSSFCDSVAFSGTSHLTFKDVIDFYKSWIIWKALTEKKLLIDLRIDGVIVGDLINDSFLRYKPAPTVDIKNIYILILIWQAHRYIRLSAAYFSRVRPKLFLTSFSTYIHHGIPVRVALLNEVAVFSFGNFQEFSKRLTLNDWVHTKNPDKYAIDFSNLDCQAERLILAEEALSKRFSGVIDTATAYMKKSAYAETGESVPDVNESVIIFLHDFYDSPHVYRKLLFPDFWEWVCFTIETLKRSNIKFFVKPHPNQIQLSNQVLVDLIKKYPDLLVISPYVTNKKLAEAGINCAVTVYGTVAHEMAYFGVPSISCAWHPHISFDFCRTALNIYDYELMLKSPAFSKIKKTVMRQQSLIFYYMHNLYFPKKIQIIKDALLSFNTTCADSDNPNILIKKLNEISRVEGFKEIALSMYPAI
jgi:hypothetical protein